MERITQTAGRDPLGDFAPNFAHFNDDVLFGENWNDPGISLKTRCIITVVALMSSGITDSSLTYHLENAKAHGVTKAEIAAIVTHVGFYAGWPRRGRYSGWQRTCGTKQSRGSRKRNSIRIRFCSPSARPTTALRSILSGKAILRRYPKNRWVFSMSPLNRAAGTTGMCTMPTRAAGRSSSVSAEGDIIRSGAGSLWKCAPATASTFPQA